MNITLTANTISSIGTLTYIWTDSLDNFIGSGSTQLVTSADTYTLVVTDDYNGLTDTETHIINNSTGDPIPNIETDNYNISFLGQVIVLSGGTSETFNGTNPLVYDWSTIDGNIISGTTNETAVITTGGTYTLRVIDDITNCEDSIDIEITNTVFNPPTAVITLPVGGGGGGGAGITCTNLSLTLYGTDSHGEGFLTYEWTDGDTNIIGTGSTQVVTSADTYTLVVTDTSNGLPSINIANITIVDNSTTPTAIITLDNTELSGSIPSIELSGNTSTGANPLLYQWSTSGSTLGTGSTQVVVSPDIYFLIVTDSLNGCTGTTSQEIIESVVTPIARIEVEYPNGHGDAGISCYNPTLVLSGNTSSGDEPLTYLWTTTGGTITTSVTGETITISNGGTYELVVTDINTNESLNVAQIVIPTNINAVTAIIDHIPDVTELSSLTPTITLTASGSTGSNLTYIWSPYGETTDNIIVTSADTYSVLVQDSFNGCSGTTGTIITQSETTPIANISGSGTLTCDITSVTLTASGSTGSNLSYEWKNTLGQTVGTDLTYTAILPSNYTLVVTDGTNGLFSTNPSSQVIGQLLGNNITASVQAPLGIVLTSENPTLPLNGSVTGGNGNLTPFWEQYGSGTFTNVFSYNATITEAGEYWFSVEDNTSGCRSNIIKIFVTQESATVVTSSISGNVPINCETTSIILNGTGSSGEEPLIYLWTTTGGTVTTPNASSITVTDDGEYGLLITDANTNTDFKTVTVVSNTIDPNAIIVKNPNTFEIPLSGSIDLEGITSTSDSGSKTYSWNTAAITDSITVSNAGTYILTVKDSINKCTDTAQVIMTKEVSPLQAVITGDNVINCNSDAYVAPPAYLSMFFTTSSVDPAWSPSSITNGSAPLTWEISGDIPYTPNVIGQNYPAIDLSSNTGSVTLEAYDAINVTKVSKNYGLMTSFDISQVNNITLISFDRQKLTSVDLTNNTALVDVSLAYNSTLPSTIDLTNNINLRVLHITDCYFTSLDLSQNTQLTHIAANGNNFTDPNMFINNIALIDFNMDRTKFTYLNTTQCTNLKVYRLQSTGTLTSVDVTQNPEITYFRVGLANITSIDLTQNLKMSTIWVHANPNLSTLSITIGGVGVGTLGVAKDVKIYTTQLSADNMMANLELYAPNNGTLTISPDGGGSPSSRTATSNSDFTALRARGWKIKVFYSNSNIPEITNTL